MLLTLNSLMGFVVSTQHQMDMIKDGKKTCILSTTFTEADRRVKYVSLHHGINSRHDDDKNTGRESENLVAILRKGKGGHMLGPFQTAKEIWDASQGGMAFKLGITFCELKMVMRMRPHNNKRNPDEGMEAMYVYRFHSAEIDVKVRWYDFKHLGRNSTGLPEYNMNSARGMPFIQYRLLSDTTLLEEEEKSAKKRKTRKQTKPIETWSMHGPSAPYSQVLLSQGTAAAAILSQQQPYYQLGPPDFLAVSRGGLDSEEGVMPEFDAFSRGGLHGEEEVMPEFDAVYQEEGETVLMPVVMPEPVGLEEVSAIAEVVDPAQDVYGMLFDTLEVCKRLRQQEEGMGDWRLDSLELIENSIEAIQAAVGEGETDSVVDALYDLRNAIGGYGWGMEMAGVSRDKIDRVKRLWRAVKTLESGLATIVEV